MTNHPANNGDYLVEVQAQVMTRDDSTQCWVPMGGGGLSTVKLCKLVRGRHSISSLPPSTTTPTSSEQKPEYVIHGEKLEDKSVVLNCMLKKDILYTRANPKFHHWNTDEKRYGLTFERSDDAKAFDHGIRHAVAELSEGTESERVFQVVDLTSRKNSSSQSTSTTSTSSSSPSPHSPTSTLPPGGPPHHPHHPQDPFLFTHPHANHHHLHRVHYMSARQKPRHGHTTAAQRSGGGGGGGGGGGSSGHHHHHHHHPSDREVGGGGGGVGGSPTSEKSKSGDSLESWNGGSGGGGGGGEDVWVSRGDDGTSGKSSTALLDGDGHHHHHHGGYKDEPYVIFDKNKAGGGPPAHEYSYPSLEPVHKPPAKRESTSMRKASSSTVNAHPPVPLPHKGKPGKHKGGATSSSRRLVAQQRAQCEYCRVLFDADENHRGSCDSAPDSVVRCMEYATCVACASGLIYHCMADADGGYRHPCECDRSDEANCKKWTALTLLSFFIPCLWCYMPLYACHRCGTACGLCGGRHKAE